MQKRKTAPSAPAVGLPGAGRRPGSLAAAVVLAVSLALPTFVSAEPEAPTASKNILLSANGGKVVSVTGQADDRFWKADNLIDGLLATQESHGWASSAFAGDAGVDYPQEIVFALPGEKPHLVTKIVVDAKTVDWPLLGRGAKDLEILVSTASEAGPWNHVAGHSLLNRGGPQTVSFKPTEAKYLMVRVLSNWGSDRLVALGEIEAYEAIMGTGELDQLISRLEQILTDLKRYRAEMQ